MLVTVACTTVLCTTTLMSCGTADMRKLPDPLYGVTVDIVANTTVINESARALTAANRGRLPTTRIVFDSGKRPADYAAAVDALQPHSYLMGELLDSSAMKRHDVASFHTRVHDFLAAFRDKVDLWEIGNEINGEWLGRNVVDKMNDAYDQVHGAGKRTALTFYYNPNCWSRPSSEMFTWIETNVDRRLRAGLDYVFISYYEGDCNNHRVSASEATAVFRRLRKLFPKARLGFGEIGLAADAIVDSTNLPQANVLARWYYGLRPGVSDYVTGGFWWHYS